MQNQYNLLYREEEREMNAYCKFNGIGIIPWGPLSGGKLARPAGEETLRFEHGKQLGWSAQNKDWQAEILGRVEKLSKKKGWSMAQVGLAWINTKVTSPIVGFSSVCCLLYTSVVRFELILSFL
jgi:aryl-alcohol dehydrogenase-like predicted oxidoreductase